MSTLAACILKCAVAVALLCCSSPYAVADRMDDYLIGRHGQAHVEFPAWFKASFLDLRDDLRDAREAGKRGVVLFLSQENCSHCKAFIDTTLSDPETQQRLRKNFDVLGIDIFNDVPLTDIDGTVATVKDFAEAQSARFTPTLIFYGVENARLLKIVGFYPPEKFNRALDYIDGGHHTRMNFRQFLLEQADEGVGGASSVEIDHALFAKPPYVLDRRRSSASRPLLVIFDNPGCRVCQRFHTRVLGTDEVRQMLPGFEAVRLNASDAKTRLIVPDGRQLSPRQWADELQLTYEVAVVFFDEAGREVHRLDAETGKDRMTGSMQYVLEKAYERHGQFLQWRKEKAMKGERM